MNDIKCFYINTGSEACLSNFFKQKILLHDTSNTFAGTQLCFACRDITAITDLSA